MAVLRYVELTPETLSYELAILPWGALEWHGSHLPLGLDGIVAESFSASLAERTCGVLFPTQYNPITTLPHRNSLQISTSTFRLLVREVLHGVAAAGFKKIALVSGHYAQGHMIELYETASWATSELGVPVFVGTPLEPLGDPSLLDHAGRFETSQLLAVRPDLVRMEDLPDDTVSLVDAVLGEHPRLGSAAEGEQLFARALDSWAEWLEDSTGLGMYYQRAIDQYDDYRTQFYRESWEQAIADWWASKG